MDDFDKQSRKKVYPSAPPDSQPIRPTNRVEFKENHVLIDTNDEVVRFSQVEMPSIHGQVDTGYAWVICFAVCVLNISTDGFCFTLNVLFPIFRETFGEDLSTTSLIGATLTGIMLLIGPVVGFIISLYGTRVVCFAGAAIATFGMVISTLAQSVTFLIFSLGLLTGFGFGCMMTAGFVSLMTWFIHRRPIAMGIASILGGSGMFIYPYVVGALHEKYGLEGCFLTFGGLVLQGCVAGLLLRPAPVLASTHHKTGSTKPGLDFKVLTNWKYLLLLLSSFLYAVGYYPMMMFVTSRAKQNPAITYEDSTRLMTWLSAANIAGRALGMLSLGRDRVDNFLLSAGVEMCAGLVTIFSIFCVTYKAQLAFCILYGLTGGFGYISLGILMGDVVSVDQMPLACGFLTFASGLAALSGGPFAGALVDENEHYTNYTPAFLMGGSLVLCGASILLLIFIAQRIKRRKF